LGEQMTKEWKIHSELLCLQTSTDASLSQKANECASLSNENHFLKNDISRLQMEAASLRTEIQEASPFFESDPM
jgi:septal ring factor EnvC (AmiA/AmiB activator)